MTLMDPLHHPVILKLETTALDWKKKIGYNIHEIGITVCLLIAY